MKKIYFFTALLVALFSVSSSYADTYKVDFETSVDTNDHDFKVATGWGHIKDCFVHPIFSSMSEYVAYSFEAGAGVDGSQALKVGNQLILGRECYDLLVTPKVSGTVSIMVKSAAQGSDVPSIKFFKVENGAKGEEIVPAEAPEIVADAFVKVTLTNQEAVCIGIRGENIYVDDFEATSAEVVLAKAMTVTGAAAAADMKTWLDTSTGWFPTTYFSCDAEGNYKLSYDITLKNTGDVTLNPGDEGYTLTLINQETAEVYAEALPVEVVLEPGEEKTVNVKVDLNTATTGEDWYMQIRENLTNTVNGNYDYRINVKMNPAEQGDYKALAITNAVLTTETVQMEGADCIFADADGTFTVSFAVTMRNDGNVALEPGTEGFTLQLLKQMAFTQTPVGEAVPVEATIQPGETATVDVTFTANLSDNSDPLEFIISEGISQTIYPTYITVTVKDASENPSTAVNALKTGDKKSAVMFSLKGQQVSPAYKGLVVKNGRIYLNK